MLWALSKVKTKIYYNSRKGHPFFLFYITLFSFKLLWNFTYKQRRIVTILYNKVTEQGYQSYHSNMPHFRDSGYQELLYFWKQKSHINRLSRALLPLNSLAVELYLPFPVSQNHLGILGIWHHKVNWVFTHLFYFVCIFLHLHVKIHVLSSSFHFFFLKSKFIIRLKLGAVWLQFEILF